MSNKNEDKNIQMVLAETKKLENESETEYFLRLREITKKHLHAELDKSSERTNAMLASIANVGLTSKDIERYHAKAEEVIAQSIWDLRNKTLKNDSETKIKPD